MIIGNFIKEIELKYKNHYFSGLCFDSSKCKKDNIFFAIKGTETDGSKFINHAIQMGAKTIVSSQKFEGIKNPVFSLQISSHPPTFVLIIGIPKLIASIIETGNPSEELRLINKFTWFSL